MPDSDVGTRAEPEWEPAALRSVRTEYLSLRLGLEIWRTESGERQCESRCSERKWKQLAAPRPA